MLSPPSLVQVANRHIPFPTAARWAGVEFYGSASDRGVKTYCPFGEFEHPDGGREAALRIYTDHGWCFAEQRYFTPVSLLAEVWGVSREDAAARALDRAGYVPADYAHLFAEAQREPDADRDALEQALAMFCEARFPDWRNTQYMERVAAERARCLSVLPLVHTEDECRRWLAAAKQVMERVLPVTAAE